MTDRRPGPRLTEPLARDGDDALAALVETIPVWLVITPLVGVVNGALFFLVAGRRPSSLTPYLVLAALAASLAQASGVVPPGGPPASLGDVHLISASLAVWVTLGLVRALGL